MAKKEVIQVIDDLDGAALDEYETIEWSLDGKSYEFDTSAEHAEEFRDTLATYVAISRPTSPARASHRGTAVKGVRSKEQTQAIREWAQDNGYEVSDRGRIAHFIIEAYEAAH
ncbi:Lsr2 family protein [Gordonia pseudamarae]|jgi:hypothetical protein|uniref:Lsr2 family protein n=1 Tax=Gordonia pseudamarae TaxID=2831662 RepID=A0ABX6IJN0_9ACTN|nr:MULTISPECIES: Lsr2 family protein [Gordonia]MBD0023080.1 Lsr2 family protein [Gordonia sp. (in: high G+C Gram-positive bacteria)]QHN27214.1 Lsr2 family protein [Gordonia pseudamarae]QHN36097.1 Lsr2 family protein [Gordonia pseudamarae]